MMQRLLKLYLHSDGETGQKSMANFRVIEQKIETTGIKFFVNRISLD